MKIKLLSLLIPLGMLFQINLVQAEDYFWIGGSGNWEDITHWATTSGGVVTHDQTPTANDDVYFDVNSFTAANQTVTINSNVGFARSLDFTAATFNPTFIAANNVTLSVFGSLLLTDNMTFDLTGDIVFGANTNGNIIDLGIHDAGTDVTFDGSGSWTVNSDLRLTNILTISSGEVVFSNVEVSCQFFYSRGNTNRTITFDNGTMTVTGVTNDPQFVGRESNIYTSRISIENLTWNSNNSQVFFTSNYSKLFVEGNGAVDFGRLSTVNEDGTFEIVNIDGLSQISFSQNLDLTKDATISADVTIGTLTLLGSHRYVFESQRSINLNVLDAVGSCQGSIIIASSVSGNASNWTATMAIQGEWLTLRDISVLSNNATASNSVDLGNITGWTISEKIPEVLYWVGGTGNWDDGSHWSLTSGGAPSGCVPTAVDDVFFDQNSFNAAGQSVQVNIPNALCKDMVWDNVTNVPALGGPIENNLLIHGSLRFDPTMIHDFQGDYFFLSSEPNNSITSSGIIFNRDIYFDNVIGGWGLEDDIHVNLNIHFISGTLNTSDQGVDCFRFNSDYTNARTLALGTSIINVHRRINSYYFFWLESENLNFDAGSSTIIFHSQNGECITRGVFPLTYHNVEFRNTLGGINSVSTADAKHTFNKITFRNSGQVTGDNNIDTLILKNGFEYAIGSPSDQDVDVLLWDDICDGLITLKSFNAGAIVRLGTTRQLEGFNLSSINFDTSPPIQAIESVDGGGNQDVTFAPASGRDLYWVGGSGDWDDSINWSTTSGGIGGECIPTIIDNVFFDDNSFSTNNDFVDNLNGNFGYCRNITFSATNQNGGLRVPRLIVAGNVDIQNTWALPSVRMIGGQGPQTILTSGSEIWGFEIEGTANVTQLDEIYVQNRITFFGLSFYNSNGFAINTGSISITNRATGSPSIDLGTSLVTIRGEQFATNYPFVVSGLDNSPNNNFTDATFDFTAATTGMSISADIEFGNFIFSDNDGQAIIEFYTEESQYESITFRGDATLTGNIGAQMDTLIFSSGKTYIFQSGLDYAISNHLDARGNNCLPIGWQSSQSSQGINLTMDANVSIDMDFVEMSGIDAICCNTYFAGNNSTDISNSNQGWTFGSGSNNQTDEGFFGADIIVCDNNDIILMPFESDQISSIVWNDGSTNISYTANSTEEISAFVTFTNNCEIRDTIDVRFETSFSIDFGPDTLLCEGSTLLLNPNIPNANYEWQDMSTGSTFLVDSDGTYAVNVDLGTCDATDTIIVNFQSAPTPPLPMEASACTGDSVLLDAEIANPATFAWTDGSTSSELYARATGEYIVTITDGGCTIMDTTTVTIFESPTIEALSDTTICEGDVIDIGTTAETGVDYVWNSSPSASIIGVSISGPYVLVATNGIGCSSRDSMMLDTRPSPKINLDADTTICEGSDITIGTTLSFDDYAWNTGQSQASFSTNQAGEYILTVLENQCESSDTINIGVQSLPIVNLGVDRSICDGDSIILDANNTGATYLWNTGSTDPSIIANAATSYTVAVNLNSCIARDTLILDLEPTPFFDLGADDTYCEGQEVPLSIPAAAGWSILWGNGSNDDMILVTEEGGHYATATLGNCSYTDSVYHVRIPLPTVDLGADQSICDGDSLLLDAFSTGATYLWSTGSINPQLTIKTAGTYDVAVDNAGCVTRDTIILNVAPTPFFDLGSDIDLCEDETIELMIASDPSWDIRWSNGSTGNTITVDQTDNYSVVASIGMCDYMDNVDVTIFDDPEIDLGPDLEKCEQTSINLEARILDVSILWDNGSSDALRLIPSGGTYHIEVETPQGCIGRDTIVITDVTCAEFALYLPTAFSPNGDNINDTYQVGLPAGVSIASYQFSVYDKWGNLVFQTNDPDTNWDGMINNRFPNMGTFIAVVDLTYSDDFRSDVSTTVSSDFVLMR